ncbi:MAG: peptidase M50 [Caulobacteraceae bacterium]
MADIPTDPIRAPGPWDLPDATPAQPPLRPQGSRASRLAWAAISTALLAAWLGWTMGWVWALGGVVGVFVHEYGHVLAMNALGCGPGRIRIIPFLGGSATPARAPDTEFKGVLIALAGPVFGLIATAPFFVVAALTHQPMWLQGALFISIISLLNLLPAPPLDGSKAFGPALAAVHPWLERGALLAVGGAAVVWAFSRGNYLFAGLVAIAAYSSVRSGPLRPLAVRLTRPQWAASVALYAVSAALCVGMLQLTLSAAGVGRWTVVLQNLLRI